MLLQNKIAQYKAYKNGVKHCTFNPNGPGVVRIHLIPPKFKLFSNESYLVILNGYYIIPVGYSWALLLSSFIDEVNKFDGEPITEADELTIEKNTVKRIKHIYPFVDSEAVKDDLLQIIDTLFQVAVTGKADEAIEKMSIRSYSKNMTAPHRMDLLVSSMTDENGSWNCNQKCRFCYAAGQCKSNVKELSTEEWKKIIDTLRKSNVPMVTFTGGEPTMRDDLVSLVDYAKWFVTRLNTNGINLTQKLAKDLKSAGLDSVQVTLYSCDEAIHNELVCCNGFSDTVNGIKNAVKAGLDISVNTPLCKKNADYVKTLEFINSLGVSFVTISGLICTGLATNEHTEYDLSEDELFKIVKFSKEYCDANEMEIDFTSPGLISKEKLESINMKVPMCGAALSNMAIAPDGAVVPCQSWLGANSSLGNMLTDSFVDIWNNDFCKKLRGMTDNEALNCPFRLNQKGGSF